MLFVPQYDSYRSQALWSCSISQTMPVVPYFKLLRVCLVKLNVLTLARHMQ
jgi:hypothetical protein